MKHSFLHTKLICLTLFALAQLCAYAAPATPNYFCDFEEDAENAEWVTWPGAIAARQKHSTWKTGEAAFYTGLKGLYITDPDTLYDNTHSSLKNSGYTVSVYREVTLEAGTTYTVSLDYLCPNEKLSVSMIRADLWQPTGIQTQTGADYAPVVKNAIVAGLREMQASKWSHVAANYQALTAGTYLLAITYRCSGTEHDFGAAVDNVEVIRTQTDPTACDYPITNLHLDIETNSAVLTWNGNADNYAVQIFDPHGQLIASDTVDVTTYLFPLENLPLGICLFNVRGLGCGGNNASTGWTGLRRDVSSLIAVACPEVNLNIETVINGEQYVYPACEEEQILLKPHVVAGGGTIDGYHVDPIEYSGCPFPFDLEQLPPEQRTQITTITRDDYWDTRYINLPFNVCFFSNTYRRALVGANGLVSFDSAVRPDATCVWDLREQPNIPNRNFVYKNCIMGVYQDYYPVPSAGGRQQIWYGVLGEWPCRKMVVCWNEVPMYQDNFIINSSMIVMYEGTSVIDVYVKNRDLSPNGWNKNRGIIGIINADGSDGIAAPGRNTTDDDDNHRSWTAHEEAWRFSPNSTPEYTLTWYKGAFATPEEIDTYVQAHPEIVIDNEEDSLVVNSDDMIDAVTVRLQYSQCNGDHIDMLDFAHLAWPRVTNIAVDTTICQDRVYSDVYVPHADTTGLYEVIVPDFRGCDSISYTLNLKVLPRDTMPLDTVLCEGEVLNYAGLYATQPGVYPVPFKYAQCDCDSVIQMVNFSLLEKLVTTVDPVGRICADDDSMYIYVHTNLQSVVYSVLFDTKGHEAGFEDIIEENATGLSQIAIPLPDSIVPNYYNVVLLVEANRCGATFDSIPFGVNYPSSIAPQKWGNVLVLLDTQNNGGYEFSGIQWYRNGFPIGDANQSTLYLGEGETFNPNDEYTVGLIRAGESVEIMSCPLGDLATDLDRAEASGELPLTFDGQMTLYDVLGRELMRSSYSHSALMQWLQQHATHTIYLVRLTSPGSDRTYRVLTH